jgi:peptide/nickel transport system permease protein
MLPYLVGRLSWALGVLILVWLTTFALAYVLPADPARVVAGVRASQADVEQIRRSLGLDRPLLDQMALYTDRMLSGDLGYSFSNRRPVLDVILQRLPATVQLALAGLLAQLALGLPLGVLAATRRGGHSDRIVLVFSSLAAAVPAFWLGYLLLLGFAFLPLIHFGFSLFPLAGYDSGDYRYLLLPAITLGIVGSPYYARLMRASLLEELGQQYLTTARAKGLRERRVLWRHAVRNALNPIVAQLGLDMGLLLGGVVVVEQVFHWPGIGRLAVEAVRHGDVPVIMGTVVFATLFIVVANIAADVANARLDPRIRAGS